MRTARLFHLQCLELRRVFTGAITSDWHKHLALSLHSAHSKMAMMSPLELLKEVHQFENLSSLNLSKFLAFHIFTIFCIQILFYSSNYDR